MTNTESLAIQPYEGDGEDWNAFALAHPDVRFCQLWQYGKVLEESYGFRPCNIAARRRDTLVAIWPATLATSYLLGKRVVSQPFSEYGGILASGLQSHELDLLDELMREVAARSGAAQIELHGATGFPDDAARHRFALANPYGCARLRLGPDPERLRSTMFDHQVRKALQKAERSGVTGFEDHSMETMRRHFWPLFLRSMKRLGSPPHPFSYFESLVRHYPRELKVFWARAEGKPDAALLGFAVGTRIQVTNIVSDPRTWHLRTNDFVHWEFIRWGCQNGYHEFDFGSVRYEGQLRFKKKWGAEVRDSGYYVAAVDPRRRATTLRSSSKTFGAAAALWSRFVPLWATTFLGPPIRRALIR